MRRTLAGIAVSMLMAASAQAQSLSASQIDDLLTSHNQARCGVFPTAAAMPALTWDTRLAQVAKTYADTCQQLTHNANRSTQYQALGGSGYVGENILIGGGNFFSDLGSAVAFWDAEKADYDFNTNTCAAGKVCGHYTQVVWAATTAVGCGISYCPGQAYPYQLICNYAPGGNSGGRPYVAGNGVNQACGVPAAVRGDFNSDGKVDLLWRNYSTGAVNVWFLNGTAYTGGSNLFTVADSTWRIEGTGDFNGDQKTDIVWRNYTNGAVNVWFMNGTAYLGGVNLFNVADLNWQIEAVGDFNGDGKDDLIWRNYATGAVNAWFMNGTTYLGGVNLFTVADSDWKIEVAGDYNGDGETDLIWRNYDTGAVNVWFMNDTTYLGGATLFTVNDPLWNIEATGDYNGDGKLDLVWRNYGSGAVNVWFLNGTTYIGGANMFNVAGASWEIAGPR